MAFNHYDPDEWKQVTSRTPCWCEKEPRLPCNGMCSGSASMTTVRRSPDEISELKAKRRREHEDSILAAAEKIRAERARIPSPGEREGGTG